LQRFDLWRDRSRTEEEESFNGDGESENVEVASIIDGEICETDTTHDTDTATENVGSREAEMVPRKKRVKKKQREEKREWRRFKRKSSKRRKEIDEERTEEEKQDIELTQFQTGDNSKKARKERDETNSNRRR